MKITTMNRVCRRSCPVVLGIAVGFAATLAAPLADAQQSSVYKWVDPQGVPHYSDQPPANSPAEELPIRFRRTDRAAVQARTKARSELQDAAGIREAQETAAAEAEEAERVRVAAERQAACKQAQARVVNYTAAQRLYKPGPNGERVYLTDEELDAERAAARRTEEELCAAE